MSVREFLRWWFEQLLSLLPKGRWRNPVSGRTLAISIDQALIEITPPGASAERSLSLAEAQVTDLRGDVDAVAVTLGPKDYLVRDLALPRLAASNLDEAVGYQIPKLLPFKRDQVLFACGPGDRKVPDGQISVWLVAIPRQTLERPLSGLDITLPGNPIRLREAPASGGRLTFSWQLARQAQRHALTRRALWAGLAATWAIAVGLLLHTQRQHLDAQLATRDTLRQDALAVSQLREQLDRAQAQFDAVIQRRQQAVSPLRLLNELTTLLDDDTWLINLELDAEALSLQGVSTAPAALIETLESSPLLGNARFDAAITQAGRDSGSRFNISAQATTPAVEADR